MNIFNIIWYLFKLKDIFPYDVNVYLEQYLNHQTL